MSYSLKTVTHMTIDVGYDLDYIAVGHPKSKSQKFSCQHLGTNKRLGLTGKQLNPDAPETAIFAILEESKIST